MPLVDWSSKSRTQRDQDIEIIYTITISLARLLFCCQIKSRFRILSEYYVNTHCFLPQLLGEPNRRTWARSHWHASEEHNLYPMFGNLQRQHAVRCHLRKPSLWFSNKMPITKQPNCQKSMPCCFLDHGGRFASARDAALWAAGWVPNRNRTGQTQSVTHKWAGEDSDAIRCRQVAIGIKIQNKQRSTFTCQEIDKSDLLDRSETAWRL